MNATNILSLLSGLYGKVTRLRNRCYDLNYIQSFSSDLPVISIGNLSLGGNAKTPLCMYVAEILKRHNFKPVLLTRGYGGRVRGPHLVESTDTALDVGDESVLLHRSLKSPVVVARNRVKGANFIEEWKIGDIIILDDGFQHRRLRRSLDILSVNIDSTQARADFLAAKLVPAGRFRENRDEALKRAHVLVFAERKPKKGALDAALIQALPVHIEVYCSFMQPYEISSLDRSRKLSHGEVCAFCGIANPQGFLETLAGSGISVKAQQFYRDHHKFSVTDIKELCASSKILPLVCTEKDAVKLVELDLDQEMRRRLFVLRCKTCVEPEEKFSQTILKAAAGA